MKSTAPQSAATSATINKAIETRREAVSALRAAYSAAIDKLASLPDDLAIGAELHRIETELAQASASINALEQALEPIAAREAAAAQVAVRAASESARQRVLKCAANRAHRAAAVDAAASAFIAALVALRDDSKKLAADASDVLHARHFNPTTFHTSAAQALPHANATGPAWATALAAVARQAVDVLGTDAMRDQLVMNDFKTTAGSTFAAANSLALSALEDRL